MRKVIVSCWRAGKLLSLLIRIIEAVLIRQTRRIRTGRCERRSLLVTCQPPPELRLVGVADCRLLRMLDGDDSVSGQQRPVAIQPSVTFP